MAKVMISIPDETLRRIDALADQLQMSRSAFLRETAEREIERHREERKERVLAILGTAGPRGSGDTEWIKAQRRAR